MEKKEINELFLKVYGFIIDYLDHGFDVAYDCVLKFMKLGLQQKVDYYLGMAYAYAEASSYMQEVFDSLKVRCDFNDK